MAQITAAMVKELRDKTNVAMMECKKALADSGGDMDKALEELRKKGVAVAAKKKDRNAKDGLVYSYVHLGGKIGVMAEINCETDFVAKNENFQEFCREICMHIAAAAPVCLERSEVDATLVAKEREIFSEQVKGKPENIIDKIVDGKMDKFYSEICLLEQPYVKEPSMKVSELITQKIAEIGENIKVKRFVRYQLGE